MAEEMHRRHGRQPCARIDFPTASFYSPQKEAERFFSLTADLNLANVRRLKLQNRTAVRYSHPSNSFTSAQLLTSTHFTAVCMCSLNVIGNWQ